MSSKKTSAPFIAGRDDRDRIRLRNRAPAPVSTTRRRTGEWSSTGAGNVTLESLGDRQGEMRSAMTEALMAGHTSSCHDPALTRSRPPRRARGLSAINAGKGAVFTHEGTNELDASIMDGRTMMAGAVAGLKHIKNPIRLARLVMEKSPHVLMVGEGAEAFAREQGGIEIVPESYFYTDFRWQQLQRALEEEKARAGAVLRPRSDDPAAGTYFGTVGALRSIAQAIRCGNVDGGITNKRFGRVGDSPIIGAVSTSNDSCAISATGTGEYFIALRWRRYLARRRVPRRRRPRRCARVVQGVLKSAGERAASSPRPPAPW